MRRDPTEDEIQRLNTKLDSLFAAYRRACPDPEPSAEFTPQVWEKIDARRSPVYGFRRWAQAFLTTAAALCLLLSILLTTVKRQAPAFYRTTYLEALAADNSAENFPEIELVSADTSAGSHR